MSSFNRRHLLALILALPLAGCGFAPVYAPGAPAKALVGRIEANAPTTRDSFIFVTEFETQMGRPEAPAYRLTYQIAIQRNDLAVTTEGAILRYNLTGQITWALTDIGTGATLTSGTVSSFTGSSATTSTVAAQTADDNARKRLMQILATQIVTKITATAGDWGAP
jgi:LPS-assembly lipoprotein